MSDYTVSDYTVPNAVGVAAVHEGWRIRRRQQELGLCCRGDLCERCETEAEAMKENDR